MNPQSVPAPDLFSQEEETLRPERWFPFLAYWRGWTWGPLCPQSNEQAWCFACSLNCKQVGLHDLPPFIHARAFFTWDPRHDPNHKLLGLVLVLVSGSKHKTHFKIGKKQKKLSKQRKRAKRNSQNKNNKEKAYKDAVHRSSSRKKGRERERKRRNSDEKREREREAAIVVHIASSPKPYLKGESDDPVKALVGCNAPDSVPG